MFDWIKNTFSALTAPAYLPDKTAACIKEGQDYEAKTKSAIDAFPELAKGWAEDLDRLVKQDGFERKHGPLKIENVTPENVAHLSGAVVAAECLDEGRIR